MAQVEVFYSLQSAYCYCLADRLLDLARRGVVVVLRPVLGGLLRLPDRFANRDALERNYFDRDVVRVADYLGLPFANPDPPPIAFEPGGHWIAAKDQPLCMMIYRLFVGAVDAGRGLAFLDHVARLLWDGSTSGWDQGDHLTHAMAAAGLDRDTVLDDMPQTRAAEILRTNAAAM
ncbi:MAG: DsbA family protein, partial [Pseudomonadota bacterium]